VALGPAIGWLDEGIEALMERPVDLVHMIYNALELDPGRELIATAQRAGKSLLVRVPHSSGMLEGNYDENTTFAENDHRRHRPKDWLTNGLVKIQQLDFLTNGTGRTLGQAALRFVLRSPAVASALPNIYDLAQMEEFIAASGCSDLSDDEVRRIEALYASNYGLPRAQERVVAAR
jgi:aryl-alcohol dehydrogenase-like predicted oxidoreductase